MACQFCMCSFPALLDGASDVVGLDYLSDSALRLPLPNSQPDKCGPGDCPVFAAFTSFSRVITGKGHVRNLDDG